MSNSNGLLSDESNSPLLDVKTQIIIGVISGVVFFVLICSGVGIGLHIQRKRKNTIQSNKIENSNHDEESSRNPMKNDEANSSPIITIPEVKNSSVFVLTEQGYAESDAEFQKK